MGSKIETSSKEKVGKGEKEHKKKGTASAKLMEKLMKKLASLTFTNP